MSYIYIINETCVHFFYVLLTVHLSIYISVISKLDAQSFSFTINLFRGSTCFEHMCSKHVEPRNKFIVKQKLCASSLLITEIKNKFICIYIYIVYSIYVYILYIFCVLKISI